jgi:hypothetical protein
MAEMGRLAIRWLGKLCQQRRPLLPLLLLPAAHALTAPCFVSPPADSYIPRFKASTIEMIEAQGGIVGWTADSVAVEAALQSAA